MRADRPFFAWSVLSALNTATALAPPPRAAAGAIPAWVGGLPTSELPLQALALQAGATVAFARRGALRSRLGRAGLVGSAASWAGLIQLHRVARQSGDVLEHALEEAFGGQSDWLANAPEPDDHVPLTVRQLALPGPGSRRRYLAARNVPYGEVDPRNRLDVWRREDLSPEAGAPVLLHIPGGAWVTGKKERQGKLLMSHLARSGWVCVTMDYRLGPKARWPAHIVDVKQSIAWVKATIAAYGGDPAFIAVTGGSAGGHLSALAALTPNDPAFQPGFEGTDTTVQAAVPLYGVYDIADVRGTGQNSFVAWWEKNVMPTPRSDDEAAWYAASPVTRVGPHAPPFFVIHGANDSLVPVEQARWFVEKLRQASRNPVAYAELPNAQHAFDMVSSTRTRHVLRAIERFLTVVRSHTGAIAATAS